MANVVAQGRGDRAYWMLRLPDGHRISLYPVVQAVLITPLYVPAVVALRVMGWTDARLDYAAKVMEKVVASLLASLSVSLLFLLLRRRPTTPVALVLTLAYAFGTTTWVISSQALWQHGMGKLLVIGTLLLLAGPDARRGSSLQVCCGLVAANRPPDVILAAALGVYGLYWAGWSGGLQPTEALGTLIPGARWAKAHRSTAHRAALFAAGAALPMALVLLYNLTIAGHILGGYGLMGDASFFHHGLASGVAGLLVSPTRGLFVFSPFLLFLFLVWRHWPRDRNERILTVAMGVACVIQILFYAKADWRAAWRGAAFPDRPRADARLDAVPVVASLQRFGRIVFLLMVSGAIVIEAVGAFCYTGLTDSGIFAGDMRAAWNWKNAPFLSFKHGLASPDLAIGMRGSFADIPATVTAGHDVVATGWARTGRNAPWQVAVVLDDRETITTRTFDSRGVWRIPIDTASLPHGQHRCRRSPPPRNGERSSIWRSTSSSSSRWLSPCRTVTRTSTSTSEPRRRASASTRSRRVSG